MVQPEVAVVVLDQAGEPSLFPGKSQNPERRDGLIIFS